MQVGRERVTAETTKRSAALEERLRNGFERIGKAMNEGVPVENWETRWIELLRQYEQISDELAAHHADGALATQTTLPAMPRAEQEAA